MLKEFVEKIASMSGLQTTTIGDLTYTDRQSHLVTEPSIARVTVHTLTGLVTAVQAKLDAILPAAYVLLVEDCSTVVLERRETDRYGRRQELVRAALSDGQPFTFGKFLDREEFVIGIQSRFQETEDLKEVLKVASNLTASLVAQAEDDGVSQKTTVKQGVNLKEEVKVKGRVSLKPYRTFREIEQPASDFVFRLRSSGGGIPGCALFEADGGKWQLDAVLAIKRWLDGQDLQIPVIA